MADVIQLPVSDTAELSSRYPISGSIYQWPFLISALMACYATAPVPAVLPDSPVLPDSAQG